MSNKPEKQLFIFRKLLSLMKQDENKVLTHALGLSSLTYFNSDFIEKIAIQEAWKYKILEKQGMLCLIVETDKQIYIAFRGTMPNMFSNWKKILNFIPKSFKDDLKAHGGFVLVQQQYKTFIQDYLNTLDHTKEIIFTGHSLGAAIASLYNIDYVNQSKCMSFASPNVLFNCKFDSKFSYSFRINQDFVTKIPLSLPFFKWTIPTNTIRIKSKYRGLNPLSYHALTNYIQSMLKGDLTELSKMI